ncbi:MAG: 7-carboxy-7-deazaguanine synthase, partial [Rhizomicrobium sp.]
ATCTFCDTDFVGTSGPGGGSFATAEALAGAVAEKWPTAEQAKPYVVCTGGEPLLQLNETLIGALHAAGFEVGIESNGTLEPPAGIDWICVSPKADAALKLTQGNELKLVYPQADAPPERFAQMEFDDFFLQPMDGPDREANTRAAISYCLSHPQWRLSLQTHKLLGIP